MQVQQTGEAASRLAVMEKLAPLGYWSLCEGQHWWAHAPIRRAAMVRRTFPSAQRQQLDTSTVVRSEPELPMARCASQRRGSSVANTSARATHGL